MKESAKSCLCLSESFCFLQILSIKETDLTHTLILAIRGKASLAVVKLDENKTTDIADLALKFFGSMCLKCREKSQKRM